MVKTMCTEANIEGRFTNHSLRATGATELFQKEVPEKLSKKSLVTNPSKLFDSMKGFQMYRKKLLAIFSLEVKAKTSTQKFKKSVPAQIVASHQIH